MAQRKKKTVEPDGVAHIRASFNNTIVIDETNFTECTPIMLLRLASAW